MLLIVIPCSYNACQSAGLIYCPLGGGRFGSGNSTGGASQINSTRAGSFAASHVAPPSRLTSVQMSKKLSTLNVPSPKSVSDVPPCDGIVGLSRNITLGGRSPPDRLKDTISVSNTSVPSACLRCRIDTSVKALARTRWNGPSLIDNSRSTTESNWCCCTSPGRGGGNDCVNNLCRTSRIMIPCARNR